MGGVTICAWAYVPAFLTVELSSCMARPQAMCKSVALSGVLNIIMFLVVGQVVVRRWGYDVGEVIGITPVWLSQKPGNLVATCFNIFQLMGNFVSYMLDSVPLGRWCQKALAPRFADTWSARDVLFYLACTLPTFIVGFALSVFVPSVNILLDFTTALTTPWVTQIYPAVLYWRFMRSSSRRRFLLDGNALSAPAEEEVQTTPMSGKSRHLELLLVTFVFTVGCANFACCLASAVGKLVIPELRPPLQIGCGQWLIWRSG